MSYIIVEVESDGPIPAEFSMVCFGAIVFDDQLDQTFYGRTRPVSDRFVPEALAVSGFSREQHRAFDDPKAVMEKFALWLAGHSNGRPVFVSDNLAFDWQFINFYFHRFIGQNPFGFSGRRIGDLYAGLVRDPLGVEPGQVRAWRRWLEEHLVTQPFKQAHREIYIITDAELGTRNDSTCWFPFAAWAMTPLGLMVERIAGVIIGANAHLGSSTPLPVGIRKKIQVLLRNLRDSYQLFRRDPALARLHGGERLTVFETKTLGQFLLR